MKHILYNPKSGGGQAQELADRLCAQNNGQAKLVDITDFPGYDEFFRSIDGDDEVILIGGDGTVNHLINDMTDTGVSNKIYYMPSGSGNDFALDVGQSDATEPFLLNGYIKDLPTVEVGGRAYRFINGIGFGIDGYCCEVGDKLHAEGKTPNYTSIAVKGLLFHYKPTNAVVTVDGVEHHFKRVWICPTMLGRHYGGGMMPTPAQNRYADGEGRRLSVMLFHGAGRIRTLMAFPTIFKGEHVNKKMVTILTGREITVRFDSPRSAQVDGETVLGVTEYTARV